MNESEMGYRGSKSILKKKKNNIVKEQRVDGSYLGKNKWNPKLRYTLMAPERGYQVRVLSEQLNKLFLSTFSIRSSKLNQYFITGFCDAEIINIKASMNLGLSVPTGRRVKI